MNPPSIRPPCSSTRSPRPPYRTAEPGLPSTVNLMFFVSNTSGHDVEVDQIVFDLRLGSEPGDLTVSDDLDPQPVVGPDWHASGIGGGRVRVEPRAQALFRGLRAGESLGVVVPGVVVNSQQGVANLPVWESSDELRQSLRLRREDPARPGDQLVPGLSGPARLAAPQLHPELGGQRSEPGHALPQRWHRAGQGGRLQGGGAAGHHPLHPDCHRGRPGDSRAVDGVRAPGRADLVRRRPCSHRRRPEQHPALVAAPRDRSDNPGLRRRTRPGARQPAGRRAHGDSASARDDVHADRRRIRQRGDGTCAGGLCADGRAVLDQTGAGAQERGTAADRGVEGP